MFKCFSIIYLMIRGKVENVNICIYDRVEVMGICEVVFLFILNFFYDFKVISWVRIRTLEVWEKGYRIE